jgi:HPt (histidine-containing phosphotransfer) domain-containing protein
MPPTMTPVRRTVVATAAVARPAADPVARSKPPVDLAQLRRFTLGNVELEREILGLFAEQAPIMLAALDRAVTVKHWRDATHTLKGSSASIGAWLVAEAAGQGERVADQPSQWAAARCKAAEAVEVSLAYLEGLMAPAVMEQAL